MECMEDLNKLIATGFRLLKLDPNKNAPLERNGVYDAKAGRHPSEFQFCSVGVACGDGLVVVDFDPRNYTEGTREMCEEIERALPLTWTVCTPRGGKHYYFKGDTKRHKIMGAIDVQGQGSYVAAPPSVRPGMGAYVWEVPPWECELAELPEYLIKPEHKSLVDYEFEGTPRKWVGDWSEVEEALSRANPNCKRTEWLEIGMALHSTGHERAYATFVRYSSGAMNKNELIYKDFSEKECAKVWRSFKPNAGITIATLFHHCDRYREDAYELAKKIEEAEDLGIHTQVQIEMANELSYEDEGFLFGHFKTKNEYALPSLESSPLLFEIYKAVKEYSIYPHEPFCYASTFSVVSSITQRGFSLDYFGGKTSTYSLILGPAGSGKDGFFDFVSEIVTKVKPEIFMNEVRSSQAMKQAFQDFPSRTMVADEWPDKLIQAFKKNANQADQEMVSLIKAVWSTKKILPGSTVKRSKDNESIKNIIKPALSIFAAGTVEKMQECLASIEFIHGGLLSRLDVWILDKVAEKNSVSVDIGGSLIERLRRLYAEGMTKSITQDNPDPSHPLDGRIIAFTSDARKAYEKFKDQCKEWSDLQRVDLKSIYDRAAEKALRYGTLHAIGRGDLRLNREDVLFGVKIATYLCNNYHVLLSKAYANEEHQHVQRVAKDLVTFSSKTKLTIFSRRSFQIANSFFGKSLSTKQRNDVLKILSDEYGFIELNKGTINICRIDRLSELAKS